MDLGGYSLFGNTLRRVRALPNALSPLIICNEEQRFLAAAQLQAAGFAATNIILEPVGRNTAPAIAVAALAALNGASANASCPDAVPLLLVLPSDHTLRDIPSFAGAVAVAMSLARSGRLVTFGVTPDKPETGYG
jgi:mannose-1-phosphate guanylyltransferase/mannose-1-phosphate guanylyltransferase/mannose-6-phosphate isomerase